MRVLFITAGSALASAGGGATYNRGMVKALRGAGHDVVIVSDRGHPETASLEWVGFDCGGDEQVALLPSDCRSGLARERSRSEVVKTMASLVERHSSQVVHANGRKADAARLGATTGVPVVATMHHPGVSCPAGALMRSNGEICRRSMERTTCSICYGSQRSMGRGLGSVVGALPIVVPFPRGSVDPASALWRRIWMASAYPGLVRDAIKERRIALRGCSRWIAPSRAAGLVLVRNGVDRSRIRWVAHGVESMIRRETRSVRPVRFGYVGTWSREKGVDLLVEAHARVARQVECELHVWGGARSGADGDRFVAHLRDLPDGRTVFHGPAMRGDLQGVYDSMDVLVLPSRFLEVFGLVVLEALSAGVPVIATRCGGPEDTVRHGSNGVLVRPNDVEDLARAMHHLAEAPERIDILRKGIQPVRTWSECAYDTVKVYEDAIACGGR